MLVKNVWNVEKKNRIEGTIFSLVFLGDEATLFDELWDSPLIYGNKNIVKLKTKRLKDVLPMDIKNVVIFYYSLQSGELKKRFKFDGPIDKIIVPNY